MGFTLSHIVLSKPIRTSFGQKLNYTALAIGTILPDIEYLLNMRMYAMYGNTMEGILFFQIPFGLILYFFAYKIAIPVLQREMKMPKYHYKKSELNLLLILFALGLGIISHVIWDVFTHASGYYFNINNPIANLWQTSSPWTPAYVCQIVSSIIGLVFLIVQIQTYLRNQKILLHDLQWKSWYAILTIAVCMFLIRSAFGYNVELYLADVLSAGLGSIFYAIIFYTLFRWVVKFTS